ncbi:mycothiol system anti-sigma-R factor [Cutibacterium sp. WCA-380-WT-3A]|uniref:Mycothiol system anti-sigma-R factor n=2 Tax=Cutibacterium porci TaxID=2605781 RepID=A0A7K0J6K9_9ACTN|nr:mycothiol system anti-sigma-R factor [Cutibacterium porci]
MTQSAGDEESCCWVIDHLQEFLHGEMSQDDADAFRRHIAACESCMDEADMEAAVSRALKRCNRTVAAPLQLRSRLIQMHVSYRSQA